jgi:hypothetical protein
MIFLCSVHLNGFTKHSEQCTVSSPRQEHFQANITIKTCLKYDVTLYYSNCITFASESVFQALNIITILNILEHAYRNLSIQFIRGGGGVILIYTTVLHV